MVRLIDVAKEAGVSKATASNVFNRPEIVRPELRLKVEVAARKLEYGGPDPKGRLLKAGKFNAIAVLPPIKMSVADSIRNPVFREFLEGVGETCDSVGANLVVVSGSSGASSIRNALVDGVIFGRVEQLADVESAQLRKLPFAVVDFDAGPDISSVRVDARAGGYLAAKHLLDLGHRRFAILSFLREKGPARVFPAGAPREVSAAGIQIDQDKFQGYADALTEAGISIEDVPMVQADVTDPAGGMLLDLAPEATAVLSMSVMQGMRLIDEAKRRGRRVPEDISIVAYNDTGEAARSVPGLTTIDAKSVEKGRRAAELVMAGNQVVQETILPELIVRGSTSKVGNRGRK